MKKTLLVAIALMMSIASFAQFSAQPQAKGGNGAKDALPNWTPIGAAFVATDIKEFWDRWHISLSTWLRDFVFMRFSQFAMGRKLFPNRHVTACVGFMLNMALMGVWHGITPDYIAYGLYHGILLAGCHWMQQNSTFYKRHRRDRWFKICSWAVTMVAVFFGFALFGGYVVGPLLGH